MPGGIEAAWSLAAAASSSSASSSSSSAAAAPADALGRVERFLCEAGRLHVAHVRRAFGASHPFLDSAVTSAWEGFLASSKQLIADDRAGGEMVAAANPLNEANRAKEAAAVKQSAALAEELRQWEKLARDSSASAGAGAGGDRRASSGSASGGKSGRAAAAAAAAAALEDEPDDMDPDLLARFPHAADLEADVGAAVDAAFAGIGAITQAVAGSQRQLRVARAGSQAASAQLRSAAFPGGVPQTKAVIRSLVAGGGGGGGGGGGAAAPAPASSARPAKAPGSATKATPGRR